MEGLFQFFDVSRISFSGSPMSQSVKVLCIQDDITHAMLSNDQTPVHKKSRSLLNSEHAAKEATSSFDSVISSRPDFMLTLKCFREKETHFLIISWSGSHAHRTRF